MTEFYGTGGYGLGLYDAADGPLVFPAEVEYYINLLILQYVNKPKARANVGVLIQALVAGGIYKQVEDAFDIPTAVGKQLDILALYVGGQRIVHGLDLSHDYFSFAFAEDTDLEVADLPGFAFTEDAVVDVYFLTVPDADAPVYALNDQEMRSLIQFLARTNSRFISLKEIDDLCFEFFGDAVNVVDNEDMTITYEHDLGDPSNMFSIISQLGFLPHPAGVEVIIA